MLSNIDLDKKVDSKAYKNELAPLQKRLTALQEVIKEKNIPVVIAFEGWSASGKGTLISRLLYPLDPRNFNVYTMAKVNEDAVMRPVLWSYFTKTPSKGRLTIYDKSWHRAGMDSGAEKWNMSKRARQGFFYDANAFEEQLSDFGALIIKFFLHISKDEQKNRFKELQSNPDTSWRIDKADLNQNKEYSENLKIFENMLHNTNNPRSPWNIIEANDTKYATIKVYKTVIEKIEEKIKEAETSEVKNTFEDFDFTDSMPLEKVDLSLTISDAEYDKKLKELQGKISDLGYKLYKKRKSVVIVYEGWDAAGKGGNIKRVTEELDPRGYEVVPIASPSKEELNHHYLWRFWNKMPKDGHIAIFDRSWYGRVMVERIEGYARQDEWQRAYKEINDMELHMHNHGTIIFKFWLHIDKDEQLKRFKARQENPLKRHKITDEDWRNREKWNDYETAVNHMLIKTDTEYAPWTIIESNNKKFARIKVLEILVKKLEKELE